MKNILSLTVCALSLLAFASTAQSGGAEASGDFTFAVGTATGAVQFDSVIKGNDGSIHGQMLFTATIDIGVESCTGENCQPEGTGNTVSSNIAVTAQFDCMVVAGNRAVMSGQINSPTDSPFFGQQTILVAEVNVAGISPSTDAFAWGVYKPKVTNPNLPLPSDYDFCPAADPESEVTPPCFFDGLVINDHNVPGALLTWTATDYELCPAPSDENPNPPCTPDPNAFTTGLSTIPTTTHCDSFPLSSYPLNLIPHGGGNKVSVKLTS